MKNLSDAVNSGKPPPYTFVPGEMDDSSAVFVTCPKGHRSAVLQNHRKHEILFESGAAALTDEYANEAVSSFAAGLERLYEFFIRVVCRKWGISQEVFNKSWKLVTRQSERQFGAFCFLYALETGSTFSLPRRIPEFRNRVLHQGYIPPIKEVYDFAEIIFLTIRNVMAKLQESAGESVHEEKLAEMHRQNRRIPRDMPRSSMVHVGLDVSTEEDTEAFGTWLERFRDWLKTQESLFPKEKTGV